jgi:hypothetical protein
MTVTRFSGTSVFAKLPLYLTDSDNNLFQGTERKDAPHPEIWDNTLCNNQFMIDWFVC